MKMVTMDQARWAKNKLLARLEGREWLQGAGIARTPEGPAIKVNVSVITDEIREAVPPAVGKVPVVLEEVREVKSSG